MEKEKEAVRLGESGAGVSLFTGLLPVLRLMSDFTTNLPA